MNTRLNRSDIPLPYPTDSAGFEHSMIDLITHLGNDRRLSEGEAFARIQQITFLVQRLRELEQHELTGRRCRSFSAGEAVLYINEDKGLVGAGIVVSVSLARVGCHMWWDPCTNVDGDPQYKAYTPARVKGIRKQKEWDQWRHIMMCNGHMTWPALTQAKAMEGCSFDAIEMVLGEREGKS